MLRGVIIAHESGQLFFYYFSKGVRLNPILIGSILSALVSFVAETLGCKIRAVETEGLSILMMVKDHILFVFVVDQGDYFSLASKYMTLMSDEFIREFRNILIENTYSMEPFKGFKESVKKYEREYLKELIVLKLKEVMKMYKWLYKKFGRVIEALITGKKVYVVGENPRLCQLLESFAYKEVYGECDNLLTERRVIEIDRKEVEKYQKQGIVIDPKKKEVYGKPGTLGEYLEKYLKKKDIKKIADMIISHITCIKSQNSH